MSPRRPMIAIVDDEPPVCRALNRLVRSFDMDTRTFTSGQDFLDLIEAMPSLTIDCVVIDVQMPGLNGLEVQAQLTGLRRDVPVVFITAHEGAETRRQALAAGAVAFLRKPFSDDLLIATLQAALQHHPGAAQGGNAGPQV
jgi:FixJ family two-component response regulator